MEPTFRLPKKIMIAVNFDGNHWKLALDAASLALKWQASLRLVHVLEPWPGEKFTRLLGTMRKFVELSESVHEARMAAARAHMAELVESIGVSVPIETNILSGAVVASLIDDATASKADLIVGSRHEPASEFSLKGLSTLLGLLSDSPVPVLVTSDKGISHFSSHSLRVLLCDDLTHYSERAIEVAYQLAKNFDHFELVHLHINTLTEQAFVKEIKEVMELQSAFQLKNNYSDIYQKGIEAIRRKLNERVPQWIKEQKKEHYQWEVLDVEARDVVSGIEEVADQRSIDLIVFGRHRRLHARPLGIGKVPFSQMLRYNKAILVVGPTQLSS